MSKAKSRGRPKGKANKVAMSFRFRPEFAKLLKLIARRENLKQARVIEAALARYGRDLML